MNHDFIFVVLALAVVAIAGALSIVAIVAITHRETSVAESAVNSIASVVRAAFDALFGRRLQNRKGTMEQPDREPAVSE